MTLFQCGEPPSWIKSKYRFTGPMRYGFLDNITTDQVAYATQASEAVFIVSPDRKSRLRMEILSENYNHCDEKLYVAFHEDESDKLSCIISRPLSEREDIIHVLLVEFEVKHDYFHALVSAVNSLPQAIINRLLPTPGDFVHPDLTRNELYVKFLLSNVPCGVKVDGDSQFKALHAIVSCNRSSPPLIVNGSFGTGKTRLLAVASHCLFQDGMRFNSPVKILVCAHHYYSVDSFIQQYFGRMFANKKNITLFRLIDSKYRGKRTQIHVTLKEISNYSCLPSQHLLVVAEYLTAQPLLEAFGEGFFTDILVDEGSQIVEPQAIGALCLAGPKTRIVIVGDSCQVCSVVN